jgi:hypothetical protein
MAVGACAQAHDTDHAGERGVMEMAGHVESHGAAVVTPLVGGEHVAPITSSPYAPIQDGSEGCCAHHATPDLAGSTGASGAVLDALPDAPTSSGQGCTALSSCGTPAVDGADGASARMAYGDTRSALRPPSLVPTVVDLSITPPPPKA